MHHPSKQSPHRMPAGARRRVVRGVAALAATAGVCAAAVAPAAAAPIDNSHFRGSETHVEQEIGWCLDVPFPLRHDQTFNAHLQTFTRGSDGLRTFAFTYVNAGVYTNVDTGESFSYTTSSREADVRVVDNGDGTLGITASGRTTTVVRAPGGGVFGIDSLRSTTELVVDHGGTPSDWDDDTVISWEASEPVGVGTLGGFDDCAVAVELLS